MSGGVLLRGSERVYDYDEIVDLYRRKVPTKEIMARIGCSDATVYRAVNEANATIPRYIVEFTPEQVQLIERLLEDECPYTEIAATIGNNVKAWSIQRRWPGHGLGSPSETLAYARARRDFERLVKRLGLDEKPER